jgi:deoxycytidylate deaminase
VTLVDSNKTWMTDQTPSTFGMPISGHAFGIATCPRVASLRGTTVSAAVIERDRVVATGTTGAAKGDMGLAQSNLPGTSAWRPPTC